MTNWSWDNLRYLLAIAEEGTLTEAAKRLGVSHTTVQRRIATFEVELGTPLLSKSVSGYQLTVAGQSMVRQARDIQIALEAQTREISAASSTLTGTVKITSTDTISFFLLPDILKALNTKYPDLDIHLHMMNRMSDIQKLEADVAIRTGREPPEQLIGRKIGSLGFKVCASKDYVAEHRLAAFPVTDFNYHAIVLDADYDGVPFARWFRSQLSESAHISTVNGFLAAWRLCKAGMGITLLPEYLVNDSDELVELTSTELPEPNDLWILGHSDFRDTERVRVVRHFLFEALQKIFSN